MAKSNESQASRQSSSSGGNRAHGRSSSGGRGGNNSGGKPQRAQARRGGGGGGGGTAGGSSSSRAADRKANPDMSTAISQGYAAGRERARAAVDTIKSAGSRAVESVGEHAIPAALIGAGLAWLLLESRGIRPQEVPIVERGKEAIGTVGHTIGDAVGTAASSVKEGASTLGEYASHAASAVGETTTHGLGASKEAIGNLWESHPLAMSAAILSAGIAAGMLLPPTSRENNLMGGAASKLANKVRGKSNEVIERVSHTAQALTGGGGSSEREPRSGSGSGSSRKTART